MEISVKVNKKILFSLFLKIYCMFLTLVVMSYHAFLKKQLSVQFHSVDLCTEYRGI